MMMEPDENENISTKTKRKKAADDKRLEKRYGDTRHETIIMK